MDDEDDVSRAGIAEDEVRWWSIRPAPPRKEVNEESGERGGFFAWQLTRQCTAQCVDGPEALGSRDGDYPEDGDSIELNPRDSEADVAHEGLGHPKPKAMRDAASSSN